MPNLLPAADAMPGSTADNAATAIEFLSTSKNRRSAARVSLRPNPSVPSTM
jgi:hypothetical protein